MVFFIKLLFDFQLTLKGADGSQVLTKALESTKESIKKLNSTIKSIDKYQKTVQEKISVSDTITENLRDHLYKIKELEHYLEYFRVVQDIHDLR